MNGMGNDEVKVCLFIIFDIHTIDNNNGLNAGTLL